MTTTAACTSDWRRSEPDKHRGGIMPPLSFHETPIRWQSGPDPRHTPFRWLKMGLAASCDWPL